MISCQKPLNRSSFGHLEGVTGVVRNNNQQITINNPVLRFERYTEALEKPSEDVEKVLYRPPKIARVSNQSA